MDASTILHELSHAKDMPVEALNAASERRAEMIPLFLKEIEDYRGMPGREGKATPLFFIFHLLGEWREKSAYRPLTRFLRSPPDDLDNVLGDAITVTTHRVIAAVFDGDLDPLFGVILDAEADEYVRSRMCEALAMVVLQGAADRDAAARFLRDGFGTFQPRAENFVWNGWQSAIALLGLNDLRDLVKQAFENGYIAPEWLGFEDFEEDLKQGIERIERGSQDINPEFDLFGDTIEELSGWLAFSDESQAEEEWPDAEMGYGEPAINPFRDVGRNDPCPCGSGKKFKKCCLP
jgi:hypothetical protein